MEKFVIIVIAMLTVPLARAGTWQCVDSSDGHTYIVSQDMPADRCQKISDASPYVTSIDVAPSVAKTKPAKAADKQLAQPVANADAYCVKIGKLTEDAARARELGATEDQLTGMAVGAARSTATLANNMIAYVFTVGLSSKSARLVGYKKCLAGDFN